MIYAFAFFTALLLALLVADLLLWRPQTLRAAILECVFWVGLGIGFGLVIYRFMGPQATWDYYTAYLLEKSLSIDNLLLFLVIFQQYRIKAQHQHLILFWGIIGALAFRALFIFIGVTLLERFHWMGLVLGLFVIYTGFQLLRHRPKSTKLFAWIQKKWPLAATPPEGRFFVRKRGKITMTPLFLVLLIVELADIAFAVDSIPAVLAITNNSFVIFSSNALAIVGLRALYSLLAPLASRFVYLPYGLALLLWGVGLKMLLARWIDLPNALFLAFIIIILAVTIILSPKRKRK